MNRAKLQSLLFIAAHRLWRESSSVYLSAPFNLPDIRERASAVLRSNNAPPQADGTYAMYVDHSQFKFRFVHPDGSPPPLHLGMTKRQIDWWRMRIGGWE